MKRFYTSIMALAIAFFGLVANAQYKVEINSAPHDNFVSGGQNFDPTELATALGTDTASLHQAIVAENIVYRLDGEEKSNTYTGNHNEWWMALDGTPKGYGEEGSNWFVGLSYDEAASDETLENDVISVYVGQMPGVFSKIYEPSTLKCTILLIVGDKEVSFDVTQNVEAGVPAVPSSLAEPVKEFSKLNIVKDYTLELNFVPGKSYEGKTYTATLDGIYEALGVEQADLDANVNDHILAQIVNTDSVGDTEVYSLSDNLEIPEVAAGGAWFGRYINYDEANDVETPLTISCPKGWATGYNTFYTQSMTLANGEFSIVSGQFPDIMKEGDTDYTYLYITVGDKAARVKVQAIVKKPEAVDPSTLVKVGETTVEVSAEIDNNYITKGFSIDMEAVVAALGCTTADFEDFYAYDQDGVVSDYHTESIGSPTAGYYFNAEGRIESWGENAAAFIARTSTSLQDGKFTIGQMPGHFTEITEPTTVTLPLIFQYGVNIYVVNVAYTVTPVSTPDEPIVYELVARDAIYKQMVPSADTYEYPTKTSLDLAYIEGLIGTQDFKLFTDKAKTAAEGEEPTLEWSSDYSCDPKPGFWYGDATYTNEEGQVVVANAGWGSNSFGITYADGVITWWQYPGQRSVGDSYLASLYLVNEENGKYIQYFLNVSFVEQETPESEDLGTKGDTIVVKPAELKEGVYTYTFDTQAIAETLGVEAENITENVAVYAFKTPLTRQALSLEESYFGDAEGYTISEEKADEAVFSASVYANENGGLSIDADVMGLTFEAKNEDKAVLRVAFEANGKRITYVIVLVSEESPVVGISSAKAPQGRTSAIFNMGGAAVPNAYGNINIITVDGVTKKVLNK